MSNDYPLDALVTVRRHEVEVLQQAVAGALAAVETQRQQVEEHARIVERTRCERASERLAQHEGQKTAAQWQLAADRERGLTAELTRVNTEATRAAAELARLRTELDELQQHLRTAIGGRSAVEHHRDDWLERRQQKTDRDNTDDIDALAGRHRRNADETSG